MKLLTLSVLLCSLRCIASETFVDSQYSFVDWNGWGTTMMYWSDFLGGMSQPLQDEIIHHLFSPEKLNLNILRYTIGGTTPGDETCGAFNPGAATESFRDASNKPYVWTRDPRSRKVLLAAKSLGADTFEAISRSPPSWMTRSGCTQGNPDGAPLHDNFDPKYAYTFADYLTEVVKYYQEEYNVTFSSVVPFFEASSGGYTGTGMEREGCNMERSTMAQVIESLDASLQTKELSFCSISVADDINIEEELASQKYFIEAGVAKVYKKVSALWVYQTAPEISSELYSLATKHGHAIWITGNFGGAQFVNMTQGLALAREVITDLRTLVPSAWVHYEVVRDSAGTDGIVHFKWSNATVDSIRFTSGYYAMMSFSKYIKKGFKLVHINDQDSVAAYDQFSKSLIIVTVNDGSTETIKTFDLGRFSSFGTIHALLTSEFEPHVPVKPPSINGTRFTYTFLPQSVTTFKVLSANYTRTDTLIKNGYFETGQSDPWFLQYGVRDDNGVNGIYPRSGDYSGSTESKLELVQTVTVSEARTYFLSAWCRSTGRSTKLGVLVNGLQGPEVDVVESSGYQVYGLSVEAGPSDVLSIYFHYERGNHTAQIDNVALY